MKTRGKRLGECESRNLRRSRKLVVSLDKTIDTSKREDTLDYLSNSFSIYPTKSKIKPYGH